MRDIDFLPEWYKEDTRRRQSVQRQYIALSVLFLIMILSNSVASRKISQANAELTRSDKERGQAELFLTDYGRLKSRVSETRGMMASARRLQTELDVATVLSELSTVVSEEVVLLSVTLRRSIASEEEPLDANGSVHVDAVCPFTVRLIGLARQAGQVAALITELESSAYFLDVDLIYSKAAAEALPGRAERTEKRLEFEIACAIEAEGAADTGN